MERGFTLSTLHEYLVASANGKMYPVLFLFFLFCAATPLCSCPLDELHSSRVVVPPRLLLSPVELETCCYFQRVVVGILFLNFGGYSHVG